MAKLSKTRVLGNVDAGPQYVTGHDNLETALSDILGIPLGKEIANSIFGSVAADGSFSMVKFKADHTGGPTRGTGWEFAGASRRVRLLLADGSLHIYEWNNARSRWDVVLDMEVDEDLTIRGFEDVNIPDSAMVEGQCLQVGGEGEVFVLGPDTLTNGAQNFIDLEDVIGPFYGSYWPEGYYFYSTGSSVKAKPMPSVVRVGVNFVRFNWPITPGEYSVVSGWSQYPIGGSDYSNINFDGTHFGLKYKGIYKVTFGFLQRSGSTASIAEDEAPHLNMIYETYRCTPFPATGGRQYKNESWYNFKTTPYDPAPPYADQVDYPLMIAPANTSHHGRSTFFVASDGGSSPWISFAPMINHVLGTRIFDVMVGIELIA